MQYANSKNVNKIWTIEPSPRHTNFPAIFVEVETETTFVTIEILGGLRGFDIDAIVDSAVGGGYINWDVVEFPRTNKIIECDAEHLVTKYRLGNTIGKRKRKPGQTFIKWF